MTCYLCGKDKILTEKIDDKFKMNKCQFCDYWYVIPRPNFIDLQDTYADFTNSTEDLKVDKIWAKKNVQWINKSISSYDDKAKKVLELGSSTGYLLYGLKQYGYEVYGTDISTLAVDLAKRYYDIDIWSSELPPVELEDNFDVVVISHLIEHVSDPVDFINRVSKYLKKSGLLILASPNLSSIGFKIFGVKYPMVSPPVHINFFKQKTLTDLLGSSFEVINTRSTSYDSMGRNSVFYNLFKAVIIILFPQKNNKIKDSGTSKTNKTPKKNIVKLRKLIRKIVQFIMRPLFFIIDKLGWGDNLILIARKK